MKKGFTLIELLIVIAILAILTTTVVLVLNPAQMLAEARDTQRMADLDSLRSAINLYMTSATTPDANYGATGVACRATYSGAACPFTCTCGTYSTSTAVGGTGWVNIKLDDTSGGSPLSVLPLDPSNGTTYYYAYAGRDDGSPSNVFEIDAKLESTKYGNVTTGKQLNDGGNSTTYYEVGTLLTL